MNEQNLVRGPAGNMAALTHGATSELLLAPLREAHGRLLTADYGELLDRRRLSLLADVLARLERATEWLDKQPELVRDKRGTPWPLLDRVDKWAATAWKCLSDLEAERVKLAVGDPGEAMRERGRRIREARGDA